MIQITTTSKHSTGCLNRREFIKTTGSAALLYGGVKGASKSVARIPNRSPRPQNIMVIITDQQHLDTIAAGGCPHVRTPALDRLLGRGVSFTQSYSPNPLCSPARSVLFTGRTSSEAAVPVNGLPIRKEIPNLGQWFSQQSPLETVYAGKWHLPQTYTRFIPGFRVLNTGIGGQGNLCDTAVSRACEAYLRHRRKDQPFLLVASFMQPHDICEWLRLNTNNPEQPVYPELRGELPDLPDNFQFDRREPQTVKKLRLSCDPFIGNWSSEQWRYYRWSYYRHIEMVDAEIGRLLRALEETGRDRDTLIVFTADHGEGMAHHQMVRKNHLYDQAARVPFLISWPGHIEPQRIDTRHVVSGLDIMPTLCDYAGLTAPPSLRGRSLRPILEDRLGPTNEFVVTEVYRNTGRMLRTERFKYITYKDDPVDQLFDMKNDPDETRNLAVEAQFADILKDHRKLLKEWQHRLDVPASVVNADYWS